MRSAAQRARIIVARNHVFIASRLKFGVGRLLTHDRGRMRPFLIVLYGDRRVSVDEPTRVSGAGDAKDDLLSPDQWPHSADPVAEFRDGPKLDQFRRSRFPEQSRLL